MKKLLLFILCGMYLSISYSQNTFNKHYHFGWPASIANSVFVTDSCYYFSGLIADTIPPYREGLVFGKLDLEGNLISFNSIFDNNKTYQNWFTPLLFSNDSNFISMGFGIDSISRYNYWMKLSSLGEILEIKYFQNAYYPLEEGTRVNDFFQHPESFNYFAASQSLIRENNIDLTPGYNTTITKLTSRGDSIWNMNFEYVFDIQPQTMTFLNNEIILGCKYNNTNLTRWNLKFYTKIIAVDTLGAIQWSWQSPSSLQQGANDMVATDDGGLIIASGRGFLEQVNAETKRILWDRGLVFKLDSNRQLVWETEFRVPYPGRNKFTRLVKAIDESGYVAAGEQTDLYGDEPGGAVMGWITKTSLDGDSLWSRKLFYYEYPDSLEYWHQIHDLQTTPDGGYLMSGQTLDRNLLSSPIQQAWFIKVDAEGCLIPGCGLVDAIEPNEEEGPALLLYPNPANDYLNVYLGNNGRQNWFFVLYNNIGEEVGRYTANIANTTYMIAVNYLTSGQYYLKVEDNKGSLLKTYPWIKL